MEPTPISLSSVLKENTRNLHIQAERSGVVADILRGRASRFGYALFLRNLLPAYRQLELGLERRREEPLIRDLAQGEVYRSPALIADLTSLWGQDWETALPLLPEARRYADCITAAASHGLGEGLLGHAYVRYLGDLNGGQVLSRLLAKSLDPPPQSLSFYDFPEIADLAAFRLSYREALDRSADLLPDWGVVIASAVEAFELNIQVSEAVRNAGAVSTGGGA